MIKIELRNADCTVIGASDDVLNGLDDILSYTDSSAEYAYQKTLKNVNRLSKLITREKNESVLTSYKSKLRQARYMLAKNDKERNIFLMSEDGVFPSGLLNMTLDWLDNEDLDWEVIDKRSNPLITKDLRKYKPFPELRYYQTEGIAAAVESGRGVIVAATGVGKSVLFTKLCDEFKVKTVIITPSLEITENAFDTVSEYFGKNNTTILKKGKDTKWINVCNIDTLANLDPKIFEDVECCIIDEFHNSAAATYATVNTNHLRNCYYRIGLTATNFRNGGDDLALQAVLSDVLYTYTIKQAIKDGYLLKAKFKWIDNKITKPKKLWQAQYKSGIVENDGRNNQIADICKKHAEDHVIILVKQMDHGERLKALIPGSVFIHGKEKRDERKRILQEFRDGNINYLIGTSVLGEGVDLPIANVLIQASGGKAKSKVIQNIGRVLRTYEGQEFATIYEFKDVGANYLEAHAEARMDICRENYPQI